MLLIGVLIHLFVAQSLLPTSSFYELTWNAIPQRDQFPTLPPLTSANVTIFGTKIGDCTRDVESHFGRLVQVRTLENEYLEVFQQNSFFVYTSKSNGELVRFELFENFAPLIADARLKKLLSEGDLELMRQIFGPEDRALVNEEQATEYIYDRRGIVFVKYTVEGETMNAIRVQKINT